MLGASAAEVLEGLDGILAPLRIPSSHVNSVDARAFGSISQVTG